MGTINKSGLLYTVRAFTVANKKVPKTVAISQKFPQIGQPTAATLALSSLALQARDIHANGSSSSTANDLEHFLAWLEAARDTRACLRPIASYCSRKPESQSLKQPRLLALRTGYGQNRKVSGSSAPTPLPVLAGDRSTTCSREIRASRCSSANIPKVGF